ncbi:PEP-CTERM sorting domain-containing protein [Adhaeretor mobilis]|uniref:Ice-binding protein C-terminal domain-containing protein n=1 Tax=Adhaeretor mobilis TaxID=1930276 RepID=A0A517MUF7_9BACT|nr:PEP-CTERM sorting domain-containing protein [Adhaeretor mobilis]QDS98514.1 hypothetical protein HG15A2_17950 [Adhaeretor mobilis]
MNITSRVSTKACRSFRSLTLFAVAAMVFALPSSSQAAILTINATGVDVQIDGVGERIFDTAQPMFTIAGPGNGAIADNATTATFSEENVDLMEWMKADGIEVDWLVEDGITVPAVGLTDILPPVTGTNEIHFFVGGTDLRVRIDDLQAFRGPSVPGLPGVLFLTGSGTVTSQSLPMGKQFGGQVSIAYTSTDAMFGTDAAFGETGVLTISGDSVVPEPTSLALAGLSLLGLGLARRRHNS